jgi:hypothetical protein
MVVAGGTVAGRPEGFVSVKSATFDPDKTMLVICRSAEPVLLMLT